MTAHSRLAKPLVDSLRKALTDHALPGETRGLSREKARDAALFLAEAASRRKHGEVTVAIESTGGEAGRRRMRLAPRLTEVTVDVDEPRRHDASRAVDDLEPSVLSDLA
jgi:hypothetical protein